MTIHPHQGINGHAVSAPAPDRRPQRAALSAAFSLMMKDIQAAGEALKSAEQRAQEFQTALALLDEKEGEEEEEKDSLPSQACRMDQDTVTAMPESQENSEKAGQEIYPETTQDTDRKEEGWRPPVISSRTKKSFADPLIGEKAGLIMGWFGKNAQQSLRVLATSSSKADARLMLEQIADSIESGDIRWAGNTRDSQIVRLRWLFPYLPPKFGDNYDPTSLARGLTPNMDLFRQLNDLCRERTRKDHETQLKNGYPAFYRSKKDEAELDRFAQQWWNEQMRSRMSQAPAAKPVPEKATPPEPPTSTLDEARAIAQDPSRWTMDTQPIIYHGVTLWPPEPDKINPISRTDAEIAYWLAFEYLVEVRRHRGKNPRIDGMDLRQKFKYLKKIPECDGVLRGLHWIASIVNNDIGDDTQNRIPLFELNIA